ncbi:phospho-sugar mutase [Microbacterium sp. STN6]|uniref:phospho-sugar mutase n=1 Tax=Microbacterium sp. STN6 TaxID=2995588 RepID=UPI00226092A8|nr:phospho-sugar mutase [Microbacterium sp. STN6]MCX7520981.1 phospho-sugar mutase [Microbacterium sp. STN6]
MSSTPANGATERLLAEAHAWLAQDPDDETRTELGVLLGAAEGTDGDDADAALTELHSRFDTRLAFGTAGLRGELAAGPNRMNRVLVAQAAAGLAAYLLEKAREAADTAAAQAEFVTHETGEAQPAAQPAASVVIGYDGRKNSDVFARDTAEIMAGAGVRAILLPRMLPTPVLAFAVRHLDVSAGVMVTASHNPPNDNGYKVYLGGADHGSQIVPPADGEIAEHILRVAAGSVADLPRSNVYAVAGEELVEAYVAQTAAVATDAGAGAPRSDAPDSSDPVVVYTAMHGVGWETAARVFEAAGLPRPHVVAEQIDPDPTFHTVTFPNPEEPGAMDLAFAAARDVGADLIIANDPDADRLAVAIPDAGAEAGYRRLSGNEVGTLLGWMVAEEAFDRGEHGTLAVSIVSSPALRQAASAYGHDFVETLTGFKWVSRAPHLIFGYEEALGYLVNPDTVRDKDGISAAALFLAMARRLRRRGVSIEQRLAQFGEQFGYYASDQISIRVTDIDRITGIMAQLRQAPPTAIGDIGIRHIDDLIDGFESLPPSDVLRVWLQDGSRVVVRPSGTEPKLKIYIDASSTDGNADDRRAAAESRVRELAEGIRALVS